MRSMVEGVRNESASLLACGLAERSVQGRRCCVFLRLNGLFRLAMVFSEITPSTALRAVPLPRKRGRMKTCGSRPRMRLAARVVPAHGHLLLVTAELDPAVHSARQRIWKFRIARIAGSRACRRGPAR